jgi:molecular chaperone DnaK
MGGMPDMGGMGDMPESPSGNTETKSQDKGKVVDADFEVVDKDK